MGEQKQQQYNKHKLSLCFIKLVTPTNIFYSQCHLCLVTTTIIIIIRSQFCSIAPHVLHAQVMYSFTANYISVKKKKKIGWKDPSCGTCNHRQTQWQKRERERLRKIWTRSLSRTCWNNLETYAHASFSDLCESQTFPENAISWTSHETTKRFNALPLPKSCV